jgi:hypothetical protein
MAFVDTCGALRSGIATADGECLPNGRLCVTNLLRFGALSTQASLDTVVSLTGRVSEKVKHAMEELAALGGVRPRLLADDTIELRPAPAPPELSQKVAEIFERAGVREVRPWVWGVAEADRMTLAARAKAVGRRLRASRLALALLDRLGRLGAIVSGAGVDQHPRVASGGEFVPIADREDVSPGDAVAVGDADLR